MTDEDDQPRAAAAAQDAAEAIRTLNHLTLGDDGLQYPGDAYSTLGALSTLAAGLPQTFQQIARFLEGQLQDGVISIDAGFEFDGDPLAAISAASRALMIDAICAADTLRAALDRAQRAISGASFAGPTVL
jgi:hypothetical protein